MKKYKVYVSSANRYFATEKQALDFCSELLKLQLGGDISVENMGKET